MQLTGLLRRVGCRAGDRYDGPACYCTDYALVPRPGFYALDKHGKKVNPHLRLVYVDDAPGDPDDGSGHYEVARRKDPEQRPGERVVELAVAVKGSTEITPAIRKLVIEDPEALLEQIDSLVLSDDAKELLRVMAEDQLR